METKISSQLSLGNYNRCYRVVALTSAVKKINYEIVRISCFGIRARLIGFFNIGDGVDNVFAKMHSPVGIQILIESHAIFI